MSIETLLASKKDELRNINQNIQHVCSSITLENLRQNSQLKQLFYHQQETQHDEESLQTLSLSQLNNKHEAIQRNIQELKRLTELNSSISEITQLLDKQKQISDLLDLQQLHTLFKSTSIPTNSSLVIYSQLLRLFDKQQKQFVQQLNDYLVLLVPDQHHIENSAILNDFNSFILKNGYVLEVFTKYRIYWDQLVDILLEQPKQLKSEEDDLRITISLTDSPQPNFLRSVGSLVKFINALNNISIKQYINSKLSKLLITKISTNINEINISDLVELIQLCKSTGWNVLSRLESSSSLEESLYKLYSEWIIDNYIEKIRQVYLSDAITKLEPVDNVEEIYQEETYKEEANVSEIAKAVQAPVQEEETIEEEETDGWNDNWDDAWDENEEEEEETKSTLEDDWNAKWDNSDQEEEDWNDKWDDNWDNESDKEEVPTKKSPKKIVKAKEPRKEAVPQEKTVVESQVKQKVPEKILISQISIKVIDIFNDYQLDRKYLVSTIKALSSVVYPPLTNSFLMINDLNYLQANLDLPLQSFIQTNWNQVIVEFYSKIKNILAKIDLSDEESETSVDLLDKWFKNLDKQLYTTNPNKLKHLITDIVEFINNWLINSIIDLDDISEFQCTKLTQIIDSAHDITSSYIKQIGISTSLASYNKLTNVRFMINNHITAIIARFYQGDLYDLTTDEIIKLIKSVFIQSELREDTINEIIEFRNMN